MSVARSGSASPRRHSVLVGTSNIAGATSGGSHGDSQGVSANAQANAGFGYGGANFSFDLSGLSGDNNVIIIIVNYFAGN